MGSSGKLVVYVQLLLFALIGSGCQKRAQPKMAGERVRDFANALYNNQLYHQAIEEYNYYLQNYELSDDQHANITYIIGDIYFERLRDYQNALAQYLKIKHLYAESPLQDKVSKKIVECLERLNRSADAQQALEEATLLDRSQVKSHHPGAVIAKIGKREITTGDLEHEISQLPPYMQSQVTDKSKKIEFLKQYIATELFYDSAKREGLDKDKEVLDAAFQAKKNFMVQKYLNEKISDEVNIQEPDVELYYKAHKDKYVEKDKDGKVIREKPFEQVKSQVMQDLVRERQKEAYDRLVQRIMRAEAVEIYADKLQ
ncbi:MAG: tol-pal system YbgF family protein [bacterium]